MFENIGHCAVTARAFPNVADEFFVVDQGMGCPSWRRKEIGTVEIGKPLHSRLEAAVQIISHIHENSLYDTINKALTP